jgi:hypothetical protein
MITGEKQVVGTLDDTDHRLDAEERLDPFYAGTDLLLH